MQFAYMATKFKSALQVDDQQQLSFRTLYMTNTHTSYTCIRDARGYVGLSSQIIIIYYLMFLLDQMSRSLTTVNKKERPSTM